jgi:hypothetical protein
MRENKNFLQKKEEEEENPKCFPHGWNDHFPPLHYLTSIRIQNVVEMS